MKVKFKKLHPDAVLPEPKTLGAACMDVVATEMEISADGTEVIYKLGFATAIPEGYKGILVPRSNFRFSGWQMTNSPGHIDSDYRGEWQFGIISERQYTLFKDEFGVHMHNFAKKPPYQIGDRVAQIYFDKVIPFEWEVTDDLEKTERGEGGFGSTGFKNLKPHEFQDSKGIIWSKTDPDNFQFGRMINSITYEFKEFDRFQWGGSQLTNLQEDKDEVVLKTVFKNEQYWITKQICLADYNRKEIEETINSYGYTINGKGGMQSIHTLYPDNTEWIIAECIFEQESGLY